MAKQEDSRIVSEEDKKQALATAIFNITSIQAFFGSTLQCLNIDYTNCVPTAGVTFNNNLKRWDMYINPNFFCKQLNADNREAVLLHEIFHIVNKHPIRVPMSSLEGEKREQLNVAADLAINQFIKNLPEGCMTLDKFFYKDEHGKKQQFPENKTMEFYYNLLEENPENMENLKKQGKGNGEGRGEHKWDGSAEEKDMLEATEDLCKRAMIKSNLDYSNLPGSVRDLLEFIKARRAELNYKALIMMALKSSLPANVRKNSWTRRSKRYDFLAPGTRNAEQPKLEIFVDTSGSISIEEANEFLTIVDEFLKVGSRKCNLNLFHTENYYSKEYKIGNHLKAEDFQSGGTDLTDSFKRIAKIRPDLSVVLTDGCFGDVNVESWMGNAKFPRTIFIISKDGAVDHPFRKRDWVAATVKIPGGRR